jgi:hypothetical protein
MNKAVCLALSENASDIVGVNKAVLLAVPDNASESLGVSSTVLLTVCERRKGLYQCTNCTRISFLLAGQMNVGL